MRHVLVLLALCALGLPTLADPLGVHLLHYTHLMPLRYLCEWLGATITYNGKTQTATVRLDANMLVLQVGKYDATLNGAPYEFPEPNELMDPHGFSRAVQIEDGVMYVPLRTICEAFGGKIDDGVCSNPKFPKEPLDVYWYNGDIGSPLHLDALFGLLRLAKLHVAQGENVNERAVWGGCTPLSFALTSGHMDVAVYLLSVKAKINLADDDGNLPVHDAAYGGDVLIMKALIAAGADIHALNKKGQTPLHSALFGKNAAMAQYLITTGLDVNANDALGNAPVHYAAVWGDVAVMKALVAAGANLEARDGGDMAVLEGVILAGIVPEPRNATQCTPLLLAIQWQSDELLAYLLKDAKVNVQATDNQGRNALILEFTAVMSEYDCVNPQLTPAERIRLLVAAGLNVDAQGPDGGQTALQYVISEGRPSDIVETLLDLGADPNVKTSDGYMLLHLAALSTSTHNQNDIATTVQLLLNHHADVNALDKQGETPLFIAAKNGAGFLIKMLLDAHAIPDLSDAHGKTPLHLAAGLSNNEGVESVKLLLAAGANVNARDQDGNTPLHLAMHDNMDNDIITQLLTAGANVDARNHAGETPLHLAAGTYSKASAINVLLVAGADVNARDNQGQTPLHFAAKIIDGPVETLLAAHADIHVTDKSGLTPLHDAAAAGNSYGIDALLGAGADCNVRDAQGYTPLQALLASDNAGISLDRIQDWTFLDRCVHALLDHGAIVESVPGRRTLLHIAAGTGDLDLATQLLAKHIDANTAAADGETPLFTAMKWSLSNSNLQIATLLLNHGAHADARLKDGRTPLHILCTMVDGNPDLITLLIARGADPKAKDAQGRTPLDVAIQVKDAFGHECQTPDWAIYMLRSHGG